MSERHRRVAPVAAFAVLATLASGCSFGRQYGASAPQSLLLADERSLAAQPIAADGELPLDYCRKACGEDAYETIKGCHLATLGVVRATPSQWAKSPPPPIGTKLLHCHGYTPGGSDLIIR